MTFRNRFMLLQAKRGDTGHAALKCLYHAPARKAAPLNGKIDLTVSWKPQFKETVSQGFGGSIE